jgi:hypothetical protein
MKQTVYLVTAEGQKIGLIVIERNEGDLIFGSFIPSSAFSAVQSLFRDFEEAANLQALSVIDELDAAIRTLGLYICLPDDSQHIVIDDVQIWSDGSISFKVDSSALSSVGTSQTVRVAAD